MNGPAGFGHRRRFMANATNAASVPRAAELPSLPEMAAEALTAMRSQMMPIGALDDHMPDLPGIIGLWLPALRESPVSPSAASWPQAAGWAGFEVGVPSLWVPVAEHLHQLSRMKTSPLRQMLAEALSAQLDLRREQHAGARSRWGLDERSDRVLSDWLAEQAEVGWWLPPRGMREPLSAVVKAFATSQALPRRSAATGSP